MSEDKEQIKICKGDCHLSWSQWLKRGTFFVFAVILVLVTVFFLYTLYEGKASVESVLSVILALFSMSMSAFFYFKADEAGKDFYKASYDFMKQQSQFLGEMNARFGEKFDSLTTHVRDIQIQKNAVVGKIQENQTNTQENSESMMNTLKNQNEEYKTLIERLEKEISEKITVSDENRELKELLENARSKEDEFKDQIKLHEEKLKFFTEERRKLKRDLKKVSNNETGIPYIKNPFTNITPTTIEGSISSFNDFYGDSSFNLKKYAHKILVNKNCKNTPYFAQMIMSDYCDEDGYLTKKGIEFLERILH